MTARSLLAALALWLAALPVAARAEMTCPEPPRQVAPMVTKELRSSVHGLIRQSEVVTRIETSSRNLYAAYPHADTIVIKLTELYVACELLRQSNMPAERQLALLKNYQTASLNSAERSPPRRRTAAPANPADPPYTAYAMTQQQAEAAVTAAEAKAKPWCVPAFPDMFALVLYERDRFLYYGAAKDALARKGVVRVSGYEFETGMSQAYGLRFSERRARAVADMLVAMGFPADKIEIEGLGSQAQIEIIGSRYCAAVIS
jgi:outer membrane protein OmpA-like peptidoglycan-associated protein